VGTGQATLDDIYALQYVKSLPPTHISIIRLLKEGYYEAYAARHLNISRSTVNKLVKALEKWGLVTPNRFSVRWKGKTTTVATGDPLTGRCTTWNVTDRLERFVAQNPFASGAITLCIPHNIRPKYPILSMRGELDLKATHHSKNRSIYIKSWSPKGSLRHLWHVTTKEAVVGVEWHPKAVIASRVNRNHIPARSREEADMVAYAQVQKGVDIWLREQSWNNCTISLGSPGNVGPVHYGFESHLAKQMILANGQIMLPGIFADKSPEGFGHPVAEFETFNPAIADAVDLGLRNAANIKPIVGIAVAASIQETLGPLAKQLTSIEAKIFGGTTLQYQYEQAVGLIINQQKEINEMRVEILALKNGNGKV